MKEAWLFMVAYSGVMAVAVMEYILWRWAK